jgi:two-component system chemotaxis response regulator CheY
MRILIADDDFVSRKISLKLLSEYGECDIAVNGKEALEVFKLAFENNEGYDLVCLDIMMPEMTGQEVLKEIRSFEQDKGIDSYKGTKIIMITALDDPDNIKTAFREQCEAYIIKPVDKEKLFQKLKNFELAK